MKKSERQDIVHAVYKKRDKVKLIAPAMQPSKTYRVEVVHEPTRTNPYYHYTIARKRNALFRIRVCETEICPCNLQEK
jgi:hypothetical protein